MWFTSLLGVGRRQRPRARRDRGRPRAEEPTDRALEVMRDLATLPGRRPDAVHQPGGPGPPGLRDRQLVLHGQLHVRLAERPGERPGHRREHGLGPWPRVVDGEPAQRVTLGGINLGVGAFSEHPDLAFEAAACLARPARTRSIATDEGRPAADHRGLYDDPEVRGGASRSPTCCASSCQDAVGPARRRPSYNDVSLAIQRTLHPTARHRPGEATSSTSARRSSRP